jgi:hypothetical protein
MIIERGFSKDPSILPEGIVVTHGREMINDQGGLRTFLKGFLRVMDRYEEGGYWMHKLKNNPTFDVPHVYIIVAGRLYGRCYFGGYRKDVVEQGYTADGQEKIIDWPHIILSGPFEKCPFKRQLKGFQGFRYCTTLF